jgi:putative addiction module component (TIGR02574 family)
MTKGQLEELQKLSTKEKIKVVQFLWDDIAEEQTMQKVPLSHKRVLDARLKAIRSEETDFTSWKDIRSKYQ